MSRIELNQAAIDALLTGPGGPVFRLVEQVTHETEIEMRRNAPVKKFADRDGGGGRLRDSVRSEVTSDHSGVRGRVSAGYLSRGVNVALLAERGRRGYSNESGIHFRGQRDGAFLFVRSVRSAGGVRFMESALRTATTTSPVDWRLTVNEAIPFVAGGIAA